MSWLRKGNIVALLAGAGLIALFVCFALDPLLKRALIASGQAAAGAKVEVGSLRTRVAAGRLEVRRLAVADKSSPMRNLVEVEEAVFEFLPGAALRGKVVIPEAALRGLRFGTPRKTSGALPRTPPSQLSLAVQRQLAPAQQNAFAELGKVKAAVGELDPRKLASVSSLQEAEAKLRALPQELKGRVGAERIESRVKSLEAGVSELKAGGSKTPAELARLTQSALKLHEEGKGLLKDVQESKAAVEKEIAAVKETLRKAEELRQKDLNGLLEAAGLPTLDAEALGKRLLGRETSEKLAAAMEWVRWAQAQAAKASPQKPPPPPRRQGVNVEFPVARRYPGFLLEKAEIAGRLDRVLGEQGLQFSGRLLGATSNAPLYGKPARLELRGESGGSKLVIAGLVDRTREGGPAELSLDLAGIPLAGTQLGEGEIGALLREGTGRVRGQLRLAGGVWQGHARLEASSVALEPRLSLPEPAGRLVGGAISKVRGFTLGVEVSGGEDDLKLKLSSDLGQVVADALKASFQAELAAQRKELEKKLDALYQEQARRLRAETEKLQQQLLSPLAEQQARIDQALKQAVAPKAGGLERLFRR